MKTLPIIDIGSNLEALIKDPETDRSIIIESEDRKKPLAIVITLPPNNKPSWSDIDFRQLLDATQECRQIISTQNLVNSGNDTGAIEASMATAGVAIAVAVFLPGMTGIPTPLESLVGFAKPILATFSGLVAVFSIYSAIGCLAEISVPNVRHTLLGHREILILLSHFFELGPRKWLLVGLIYLLILSILVTIGTTLLFVLPNIK